MGDGGILMPGNGEVDTLQNQQLKDIAHIQTKLMDQISSLRERVAELSTEVQLFRKLVYAIGAVGASALGMNISEFIV